MRYLTIIILLFITSAISAQTKPYLYSKVIANINTQIPCVLIGQQSQAYHPYRMAMAWEQYPGQTIQGHFVRLNADSLFVYSLSVTNTVMFSNAMGKLTHDGTAIAKIRIPANLSLRGHRFSIAAFVYSYQYNITHVTNAWEVLIL